MGVTYYIVDDNTGLLVPKELETPFFVNTEEFRREGLYFKKHNRYPAFEDYEYWDEQERRIIHGYSVGGVEITGEHYAYLNFGLIDKVKEDGDGLEYVTKAAFRKRKGSKVRDAPDFWDIDYEYFHLKKIARQEAKHLSCGKARRKGWSFKNGSVAARRYKFQADSLTVLLAHDKQYLWKKGKGLMTMANDYVDFYNRYTIWGRSKLIDSQEYLKEGYIDYVSGIPIEAGFKSEIIAVTAGGNADALRGKGGALLLIEESGKFPNLADTYEASRPLIEEGDLVVGQIVMFGTGGGDEDNWDAFKRFFYEPEANDFLPIKNQWEEGMSHTKCGYFVPDYMGKIGYIDTAGNSKKVEAKEFEERERKRIANTTGDVTKLQKRKMENPFDPAEAFSVSGSNIFPVDLLERHRKTLETDGLHMTGTPVDLVRKDGGGVGTRFNDKKIPISRYPHKFNDNLAGCPVIYKSPFLIDCKVPDNLYIICLDPYAQEKGESLGAAYVIMNPNNMDFSRGDIIVAEYVGRPDSQDTFNETLFLLAELYNAKIAPEMDNPGDTVGYAKRNKDTMGRRLTYWLADGFDLAFDEQFRTSTGKRTFGMIIGSGKDNIKKNQGDRYLKEWLLTQRTVSEEGVPFYNLQTIKSLGLLDELIKYNSMGNFDRVSALRIGMYHMRELDYNDRRPVASRVQRSKFFETRLYK